MKIAIINESAPTYNLATARMLNYFRFWGHEVFYSPRADMFSLQCDQAYISTIFTWHLPQTVQDIRNLTGNGVKVEVGGPAPTAMANYIERETGVKPHLGLDKRFEHVPGSYEATFTSRGCPRSCEFCIVKQVEGNRMTEYDEFPVPVGSNPYVCDNNILATSWRHQELVVDRLRDVKNLDLNSGFDDRIFIRDPEKYYRLYRNLHLEAWRFAYDKPEQKKAVEQCSLFLHSKGIDYRRIIVFCLVGWPGTTFEQARRKLQFLVDIEVSPYPMRYRPLDSLTKDYTPPGWQPGDLERLFLYYGVPWRWRTIPWEEFRPNGKAVEEAHNLLL